MTSWIIQVKAAPHLAPLWIGNIVVAPDQGRNAVKPLAEQLLAAHFPDGKIIAIARGRIDVHFDSMPENYESWA